MEFTEAQSGSWRDGSHGVQTHAILRVTTPDVPSCHPRIAVPAGGAKLKIEPHKCCVGGGVARGFPLPAIRCILQPSCLLPCTSVTRHGEH